MQPEQSELLEYILGHVSVGTAILGCPDLRFRYANAYFLELLEEPWRTEGVVGQLLEKVATEEIRNAALPVLQQVCSTGQSMTFQDIPYEGFLKSRGRTYWRVSIEPSPNLASRLSETGERFPVAKRSTAAQNLENSLLITIEDVTNLARSRMHMKAIHSISSAIAGPLALPQVLDRILQAVQEMVGSRYCAILLIDHPATSTGFQALDFEEQLPTETRNIATGVPMATIAVQKGIHHRSRDWHPKVSERLLLGKVIQEQHTKVVTNTNNEPGLELPFLDDQGIPRRPGSVLCVPIFEPAPDQNAGLPSDLLTRSVTAAERRYRSEYPRDNQPTVLGTIEVYHRRSRGFPTEEISLLEQFAQQAGLAIQNARLFRDIDHLARLANRHARQRQNVMQAIPDGVIIYDARWRVAEANPVARKLLGWSDDVIGLHITEALARSTASFPRNSPAVSDLVAELEGHPLEKRVDEFKMIGADGQHYTIRRSKAPIQDDFGNIFAFAVVYHDVTEQAAARERIEAEVVARTAELAQRNEALQVAKAAQEQESRRMQLLLERLPSGVMLVSAEDDRITVINHQAVELLQRIGVRLEPGDDPDETLKRAIGMNIEQELRSITVYGPSGSTIPYEEHPLFLALRKGETSEAELHINQPDGQPLWLLTNAGPFRAGDGTITGAVLVWHDITSLKALERAREDFFTTMAHELKTPLANIRAHVSALLTNDLSWSPEAQQDYLQTADEQIERLVGMVNHFLDASRVEAKALRLELEPILLPEMFEDLQDRLEALITSSQRRLEINIPRRLPSVLGDYELIMSVLTNLLSNAFRYAPEGDTVRLEAEPVFNKGDKQPSSVELRVIDRGPGMTEERQAELFTRFSTFAAARRPIAYRPGQPEESRRRGSARWSPATGLGLYISRGIIEAHGSTLTVKSSPGQGATFAFTLAVAPPASAGNGVNERI